MVDIVNAVNQIRPLNLPALLNQIETIKGQRNQNALAPLAEERMRLQNQVIQGDIGQIDARNDLLQAQLEGQRTSNEVAQSGLDNERRQQALARLSVIADRGAQSDNPAAFFSTMAGSPEVSQLAEQAGLSDILDPANLSIEGMDDDQIRQEFGSTARALQQLARGDTGQTAASRSFDDLTAGFTEEEKARARRVAARIEPPAGTSALERFALQPELARSAVGVEQLMSSARAAGGQGGLRLTPGQKAVDNAFASDFVEWRGGGFADVEKNIGQLSGVIDTLETGESNITGPGIGLQPNGLLALTNPAALDTKEQVEEVVQRNLRVILGAQFTEKEGERLIQRAYNPFLEESLNAKRLNRLVKAMSAAAKSKEKAARYFENNGTLAGYKGEVPSLAAIENAFDNSETKEERAERLRQENAILRQQRQGQR